MWEKIGQWIIRFLGGLIPTGQKPFGDYIGKVLWFICLFCLCTFVTGFVSNKLFPPKPDTINVSGDYIAEPRDVIGVGCNMWRLYHKTGLRQK